MSPLPQAGTVARHGELRYNRRQWTCPMLPNPAGSTMPAFQSLQPLLAQLCPVPIWPIFFVLVGPFILAGIFLIAAIVVCFRNRRAAAVCLLLAAVSLLLGCAVWWND